MTDQIMALLLDPFRIGLLIALVYTTRRTAAATGTWIPLAAGAVFVAVVIPVTMQGVSGAELLPALAKGLVANLVILAVVLAIWTVLARKRG